MATSQNGWAINPPLAVLTVHGVTFGGAHTGDAHVVLEYVATRYDAEVERLISGTCGCYNPRKIPGTNTWSNHASATAIDCNWQRHPLGARSTYTAAQVRTIRTILSFCDGVIRWGGDFGNVDEMHFEINKNAAAVKALATKIKAEDDMEFTEAQMKVFPWQFAGAPFPAGMSAASVLSEILASARAQKLAGAAVLAAVKDDADTAQILAKVDAKAAELAEEIAAVDEAVWAKMSDPAMSVAEKVALLRPALGDDAAAVGELLAQPA